MMNEKGKSQRSNKGIPPDRLGITQDKRTATGGQNSHNETPAVNHCDTVGNKDGSTGTVVALGSDNQNQTKKEDLPYAKSTSSRASNASHVKKLIAKRESNGRIYCQERTYDALEKQFRDMEIEYDAVVAEIVSFEDKIKSFSDDENPQDLVGYKKTLQDLQLTKIRRQELINKAQSNLHYEAKELARIREEENENLQIRQELIDQEEEEKERNSIIDKNEEVDNWAQTAANSTQQHQFNFDADAPPFQTKNSSLDDLAQVLTQALKKVNPSSGGGTSDSTRTLLARQVQGRDLPFFSGAAEEWPAFIAAYDNSNKNCRYTDSDNLSRLQKSLKGDAKKMVQWLLITPDSVPQVIGDLRKRYGNPEVIIQSLISRARELAPVRMEKINTFIEYGIGVRNLVGTIVALKQAGHLSNPALLTELRKKLPAEKQMEWIKKKSIFPNPPTLKEFAEWIQIETEAALEMCAEEQPTTNDRRNGNWRNRDKVHSTREEDTASTSNSTKNNGTFSKKKCGNCSKEDHRIYHCTSFKSMSQEERLKVVREKRLCFPCLNSGHQTKECRSKRPCGINDCQSNHNRLLHKNNISSSFQPTQKKPTTKENIKISQVEEDEEESLNVVQHAVNSTNTKPSSRINVGVIPVILKGPKGEISTFAELDNGATVTVIDADLAKKLGLRGEKTSLKVHGFQSTTTLPNSENINLTVLPGEGSQSYQLRAKTVPDLKLESQSIRRGVLRRWKHLEDVPIKTYENAQPKLLIGLDNPQILTPREVRSAKGNSPFAMKTLFGWVLMGPIGTGCHKTFSCHHMREEEAKEDSLHQLVKNQFLTESLGIQPSSRPRTREDRRGQDILDQTVRKIENGWETGLLWRSDDPKLPSTKENALKRLESMERRMERDSEFKKIYSSKIQEYQNKGFARILSPAEAAVENDKTFYLPHFMNINPKKPGKFRFVFDAASRVRGSCLNDHLLQGPDKMTSLPGVLMKFRQRKFAITGDIQDMFHRVRVREDDAMAQRFLWREEASKKIQVMQMDVLIFGATCSPVCATEAKNKNALLWKEEFPEAHDAIINRHYVDDYLDSCDTEEETIRRFQEVSEVHSRGGFRICNWLSNSPNVLKIIPEDDKCKIAKTLEFKTEEENNSIFETERVLGLFWKPEPDIFTFSLNFIKAKEEIISGKKIPTKREVLSLVMSVYDPLGLISILTIQARMILQSTWRSKVDWNDKIPDSLHQLWFQWLMELKKIPQFKLPRCYSSTFSTAKSVQLHIFGDASEEAYGTVGYFRIENSDGISTALVMSRAKVAPMKALSIPRLELQAAVIGTRMANFIIEEHEINITKTKIIFWSDSSPVLGWIRSDSRRHQQFVAHRIGEIQENTENYQWRWIPTKDNVADELTRSNKACDWSKNSRWLNGPAFLLLPENEWPKEPEKLVVEEDKMELKPLQIFHVRQGKAFPRKCNIFDTERFSTWRKLVRTTAFVLRLTIQKLNRPPTLALTMEEVEKAKKFWWKKIQEDSFEDETAILKNKIISSPKNTNISLPKSSKLSSLNPYLNEEGIIRIRGRIDNATIPMQIRRPVILDPAHPVTKKIIEDFHRKCGHHGYERIINEIRQQFYVFHLRAAVKKAKYNCQECKNAAATSTTPEMGQLPDVRLTSHQSPFTNTGLDYFGPIEVVVKRSREKRYGALFTCMATRAIHLEIAGSLSTDSCIMAIRRFVARRGVPLTIRSDNGTNFQGASSELKEALKELDQEKMTSSCTNLGIKWYFNPPAAPHMGGSWERMVGAVKKALGKVLQIKNLSEEVLYTFLTEAEHSVNSHPLTHVPDDPEDSEALTPNHFLLGKSSNLQQIGVFEKTDLVGRKQWRAVQHLADCFWRRWIKEYLPTLLRRTKWNKTTKPVEVGDVVLEVDPNLPRNTWPKGLVVKTFPGQDGIVRVVDIRLGKNGHIHRRPVSRLCVLDVQPQNQINEDKEENNKSIAKGEHQA